MTTEDKVTDPESTPQAVMWRINDRLSARLGNGVYAQMPRANFRSMLIDLFAEFEAARVMRDA